jgi:flagellar biosynthesis/type III secretory pathway protein FliH
VRKEKQLESIEVAKKVKARQKERSPNASSYSLELITKVKRYRDAGIPQDEIINILGRKKSTIQRICSDLNMVELTSPEMKELAVDAAKRILESEDNNNVIKVIDRVFEREQGVKQSPSVNINIEQKDFTNKDYDFVDMDSN